MTHPDLSTLPQRMRYAAGVLEEAVKYADLSTDAEWTPQVLRGDADVWEREDRIEELARALAGIDSVLWPKSLYVSEYRRKARELWALGWRKVGDA